METPMFTLSLVLGGIRAFSQLYRSYPAEVVAARVGSFAAGFRSLTRSQCLVFRGESGMPKDMVGSGVVSGSLSKSELFYRFHMADLFSDSESGSWAYVPVGQSFCTGQWKSMS